MIRRADHVAASDPNVWLQIYHVTGIAWLSRALRMTFIFFWGRWYLPIPNRVPVVTVVGDPVRGERSCS